MADYSTHDKSELLKVIKRLEKELKTKKYGLVWDSENIIPQKNQTTF